VPTKIYRIKLSEDERVELALIRDKKRGKPGNSMRALAMLLSDQGSCGPALKDADIQQITGIAPRTLERLRKRCCEVGPLGALERKPRETPAREIKITGEVEARITQLACSQPPEGELRWTLRLLAKHLVEIDVIENISHVSVGTVLKKVNSNHGGKSVGVSRPSKMPPS
jgi:hypothetical protein